MACSHPDDVRGSRGADAVREGGDERAAEQRPTAAQRVLEEVADALSITTALLHQDGASEASHEGPASLIEASTLLQAFLQIEDPDLRRRCLAFVQDAAQQV